MSKDILKRDVGVVNRNFGYSKGQKPDGTGGVSLGFTLRIDIKQELKDLKECLEAALVDVTNELNSKK